MRKVYELVKEARQQVEGEHPPRVKHLECMQPQIAVFALQVCQSAKSTPSIEWQQTMASGQSACAGCTNPSAANYNPSATSDDGTCTFVVPESDKELSGDLYTYVTSSLSSLWGAPTVILSVG